jgi:hypothetical protein
MNTHNLIINFGKHKGTPWTRLPIQYLQWIANEEGMNLDKKELALSELKRRGTIWPEVKLSIHAIDRASLKLKHYWQLDNDDKKADGYNEVGLYSWLHNLALEAITHGQPDSEDKEIRYYQRFKLVFYFGEYFPELKTIMINKNKGK